MDERGIGRIQAVVAAFGLLTASIGGAFALGVVGAPTVEGVENRFGPVNDETTYILTDLVVNNPNPIGVRLGGTTVNYTVKMNDVGMATGTKQGLDVDAGNTTLAFNTTMRNDRIPPWWASHVRNGEVTNVTIDATVETSILGNRQFEVEQERQVETNLIGQFNSTETRPVDGPSSPLYENPVLYINRTSARWGEVTNETTPLNMDFVAYNPSTKPYTITEVGYVVSMNNVTVADGATEQTEIIEGGTTETIEANAKIDNSELDDWWVTHLENDQVTNLRIDFYAKVSIDTPAGETKSIRLPLNDLTYEQRIETDIFGTKGESSGSASTGDDGTTTPDGTATSEGDDGGTTDDTATPTDSPTATPTPTDDGSVLAFGT